MSYFSSDYQDMILCFNENNVRFMMVGAYAMAFYGYVRSTGDLDFWVAQDELNATNMINALSDFFGGMEPNGVTKQDIMAPNVVLQYGVEPNRIDILTSIDGVDFEEAWACKMDKKIDDLDVFVADIFDLIKNKMSTGRPKDKLDVIELKKIVKHNGYKR